MDDLDDRSDVTRATGDPVSVPAMFDWRRQHDPGATFIITPDGVERSYATLGGRIDDLAAQLAAGGVSRGDVIGVYCWNDPAWVVASFAVWSVGGVVAACGGLTRLPEVERRLELVGSTLAIVDGGLDRPAGLPTIVVDHEGDALDPRPADPVDPVVPVLDGAAAIMFTSGTTGVAKPIVFSHRRIADGPRMTAGAYSRSADFRPRASDPSKAPAISFNPFGHAASLGRMVFRMYVGRSLLLVPKFDIAVLRDLAARYPLDTLQLTPAMIHSIAYASEDIDLTSLKYVNSGTAPLPISTRERFESRYGVPVLQAYGATEGGVTALERYDDVVAGRRGPGSVGRVPEGMPFRIVDPQGNDVPVGGEGELLGRVDRTSSKLTSDGDHAIETDRDGWYHTGDLARLDEHGILYITGRIKEMMIVGGFNVYPGEVEDVLRRSSMVRDAVVVPKPDDRLGEMPVAGVVWEPGLPDDDVDRRFARLREECRSALEAYKVPRQWFVLDALPLNTNGKLDRHRAAELAGAALGATDVIEGGA
jgi:long-chain acyl-CoA synthetase